MNRSRVQVFVLLGLVLFPWSQPASFGEAVEGSQAIDLNEAIDLALAYNRDLARSSRAVEGDRYGLAEAAADFQLRLRPQGATTFSSEPTLLGYGLAASKKTGLGSEFLVGASLARLPADEQAPGQAAYQGGVSLSVRQPLLRNYGRLIHREATIQAESDLLRSRRALELQKGSLVVETVSLYEEILRLERSVNAARASFDRMDRLYRVTRAKEAHGKATRADTLRVEWLRGLALTGMETGREQLASTRQAFAELLGFEPDRALDLAPAPLLAVPPADLDNAVQIALRNRVDYAQALQDYGDQRRNARIARRALWPDITVSAGHDWFAQGEGLSGVNAAGERDWFAALAFGTEFNKAGEQARLGRARADELASRDTIEITRVAITRGVQQQCLAYRRAHAELKLSKQTLETARRRARLTRRLFELGRGDNFSVTDAEEALLQSEDLFFTAKGQASLAGYRLLFSLGTITDVPKELKPDVEAFSP